MKRAVLMALGIGTILTSAAAFSYGVTAGAVTPSVFSSPIEQERAHQAAREAQRSVIESRYQAERAKCSLLGGVKRDNCLIESHASRGRSMLAAANPYEVRP